MLCCGYALPFIEICSISIAIANMCHLTNPLDQIPKKIQVFVIPGNHDLERRALPQSAIPKKVA
jgi:DNA polymerase II small subunit